MKLLLLFLGLLLIYTGLTGRYREFWGALVYG